MRVAVDFGTSSTCVAIAVPGREPQVVTFDGQPLLSSAAYVGPDGRVFVGPEADRQAAIDPSRYEPHPKRRIDETELLLGASVVQVRDVIRAVLRRAVDEARRVGGGGAVDQLVLTHPADWGGIRTRVLRQAGNGLATRIVLVPEPVAAAVFHAARFPAAGGQGTALAVLDLGGGTVDVSVVRGAHPAYEVLATRGDHTFGGADVDQLLLDHVGSIVSATDQDGWRTLVEGRELADRRRRRVIHQDVQGAKESLSRHTYTDVPMPPPFPDVHVTRPDLERLITAPVDRAARLTAATIAEAGLDPAGLAGIFLVGGSSRIPLVSRLVLKRCGVVPTTLDQPETVVARGALLAVAPAATQDTPGAGVVMVPRDQQQTRRLQPAHRPVAPPRPSAVLPPPPAPPSSRRKQLLVVGGTAALLAAAASVVVVLLGASNTERNPKGSAATTRPSRVIAQYEYQFALPDGWVQTGGEATKLRTEIKPAEAKSGDDVVFVQQVRLSFDSTRDRGRAVDKLRGDFQAAGAAFSEFDSDATFAGREVIHYRQSLPNKDATVDWYVLFEGSTQVSIGCQSANGGTRAEVVAAACETIVRTVTITG